MPVKLGARRRGLGIKSFTSRASASASGVSTKISRNSPSRNIRRTISFGPERGDEAGQDDQSRIGHQFRHLADAADILDPVGFGEPRSLLRPWRTLSPSSRKAVTSTAVSFFANQVGDGRLARAGQAGEPQHGRFCPLRRAWVSRLTSSACQWTFSARRRQSAACRLRPAFVSLSIRMKPPSTRLGAPPARSR